MKQKRNERKKRKRARNKIKEMLFHNANCAASITPQLASPLLSLPRPRLVLMSNVKRMRRRRPIVAGDEPQSAIWKCGGK